MDDDFDVACNDTHLSHSNYIEVIARVFYHIPDTHPTSVIFARCFTSSACLRHILSVSNTLKLATDWRVLFFYYLINSVMRQLEFSIGMFQYVTSSFSLPPSLSTSLSIYLAGR